MSPVRADLHDDGDHLVHELIGHGHLDHRLRQQADVVLAAAIDRLVALLASVAAHFRNRHAGHRRLFEASRTSSTLLGRMMHLTSFIFVANSTVNLTFMSTPCTVIIGALELLERFAQNVPDESEVLTFSDDGAAEGARSHHRASAERDRARAPVRGHVAWRRADQPHQSRPGARRRRDSRRVGRRHVPRSRRAERLRLPVTRNRAAAGAPNSGGRPVGGDRDHAGPSDGAATQNLDYRGTRRAPRFRMAEGTEAQVDGALATVVDLVDARRADPVPDSAEAAAARADDSGGRSGAGEVQRLSRVGVLRDSERCVRATARASNSTTPKSSAIDAFCMRHNVMMRRSYTEPLGGR